MFFIMNGITILIIANTTRTAKFHHDLLKFHVKQLLSTTMKILRSANTFFHLL